MTVHLARLWRSKNFNELIGQELSVRLLKNSLFKKTFFPAYLFSGLRGSGKTSMGRIFAAAVNCEQLESFVKEPQKTIIPCSQCISCLAILSGQHPDFIEIDAASHTGVDNMRSIIENASLLPTLASKKIYLIDEAHMLSKAAFNAALKILEEPPAHVMFILATTDPEKIIETIKSRCFQVFFDPVPAQILADHLQHICSSEKIEYDIQGLILLAEQSGGSVRDALTMLERIALAQGNVTALSVETALGLIKKNLIEKLFKIILAGNKSELSLFIQSEKLFSYDSFVVWRSLTDFMKGLLYDQEIIKDPARYHHIVALLTISYETELLLLKTSMQAAVVEYMLVRMVTVNYVPKTRSDHIKEVNAKEVKTMMTDRHTPSYNTASGVISHSNAQWQKFIELIKTKVEEPLVVTLFSSAIVDYDSVTDHYSIACLKEHELFKEWIDNSITVWKPLFQEIFGEGVECTIGFTLSKENTSKITRQTLEKNQKSSANGLANSHTLERVPAQIKSIVPVEKKIVSENIAKALKIFPGTIQEG